MPVLFNLAVFLALNQHFKMYLSRTSVQIINSANHFGCWIIHCFALRVVEEEALLLLAAWLSVTLACAIKAVRKPQLIRLSGWWLVEMETDGRETWWWHCLLSGITKSLMEVRIHTSPYWLPTVLPPLCPKTPTGEWCTISFETGRGPDSLKSFFFFWTFFYLQDWSHSVFFFWSQSALQLVSSLRFIRCLKFY